MTRNHPPSFTSTAEVSLACRYLDSPSNGRMQSALRLPSALFLPQPFLPSCLGRAVQTTAVTVLTVADRAVLLQVLFSWAIICMLTLQNIKSNLVGPVLVRTRVALDW